MENFNRETAERIAEIEESRLENGSFSLRGIAIPVDVIYELMNESIGESGRGVKRLMRIREVAAKKIRRLENMLLDDLAETIGCEKRPEAFSEALREIMIPGHIAQVTIRKLSSDPRVPESARTYLQSVLSKNTRLLHLRPDPATLHTHADALKLARAIMAKVEEILNEDAEVPETPLAQA